MNYDANKPYTLKVSGLSHEDKHTIISALYTAAEKYDECRKAMPDQVGFDSIRKQFGTQAADARRIAQALED